MSATIRRRIADSDSTPVMCSRHRSCSPLRRARDRGKYTCCQWWNADQSAAPSHDSTCRESSGLSAASSHLLAASLINARAEVCMSHLCCFLLFLFSSETNMFGSKDTSVRLKLMRSFVIPRDRIGFPFPLSSLIPATLCTP